MPTKSSLSLGGNRCCVACLGGHDVTDSLFYDATCSQFDTSCPLQSVPGLDDIMASTRLSLLLLNFLS